MSNHRLTLSLLALSTLLLAAAAAPASAAPQGGMGAAVDSNGDGKISEQEWLDSARARFEKLDRNHDGVLDSTELQQARDNLRARFRKRWEQRQNSGNNGSP